MFTLSQALRFLNIGRNECIRIHFNDGTFIWLTRREIEKYWDIQNLIVIKVNAMFYDDGGWKGYDFVMF